MTHAGPVGRRRAVRPSGADRESAILATAEELLETRPFAELSVDDLARGAGISRPTFYFYFAAKEEVLLRLLDRVVAEAADASRAAFAAADGTPEQWRAVIAAYHRTFRDHRAVTLACASVRQTDAGVRELWARSMDGWVQLCAEQIEYERRRGTAPDGLPARELAIALNSLNERVLYGTFSGDGPALDEERVVDVLATLWVTAIHGAAAPSVDVRTS